MPSSLRTLIRHPAYVLTSIATLTLAVGANLVVFSFVNALWLRPAPIADPDRVVVLGRDFFGRNVDTFDTPDASRFSELALELFRQSGAFEGVAGQVVTSGDFAGHSPSVVVEAAGSGAEALWITPGYFSVLGVRLTGREFVRGDGEADGASPVVISDRFWRTVLGARPDVLGMRLAAQPVPLDVVGVAPPGFHGARRGERADYWLPHQLLPRVTGEHLANRRFVHMPMVTIARLKPGVSVGQARALVGQNGRITPDMTTIGELFGAADLPMVRIHGGSLMTMTAVAAAFVLVGGCATLMALALVHYERRSHELAIRAAMGATRSRLASQLSLELLVLGGLGTGAAVLASSWAIRLLPQVSLPGGIDLSRLEFTIDWRMVFAALGGCTLTLAVAGMIPVARFTRASFVRGLISPAVTGSRSSLRIRKAVLAVHVGATTTVLVAAALFVQSIVHALAAGPGFDAERTIFAAVQTRYPQVNLEQKALDTRVARDVATSLDVIERIKALPGVEVVALGQEPIGPEVEQRVRQPKTLQIDSQELDTPFGFLWVSSNYLDAIGTPLAAGRPGVQDEAVITPALAEDLWPGESPLGKRVTFGLSSMTVVGVADLTFGSVRLGRSRGLLQFGDASVPVAIRGTGALDLAIRARYPEIVATEIRRLLSGAFPDAPVVRVTVGEHLVEADLGRERLTAWMFSGFGFVAVALALVSVFGLVAHLVESRWREFAVRMALGGSRADVAGRALWASLEPALIGSAGGLIASIALARTVESYLFGLGGVDALTYGSVVAALIVSVILAGGVACRRLREMSLADSLKGQ